MLKKTLSALAFCALLPAGAAFAETPEEKGLAIAIESDKRDTGFKDQVAEVVMTLSNRQGQTSVRNMRIKTLEVDGDGDKGLTIFDSPRDVKGTAVLTHSHALESDDQWLYLPALKRVKRIASANKSGPFMGSEFAYEDISSQEVEKYKYKYLRDEKLGDRDAFVIERIPQYRHSGYTRMETWLDKEMYQPLKIEFYDRKNTLLKTLSYEGYQQYLDRYWRADVMKMENHQTGKKTRLEWKKYSYNNDLGDSNFNKNALKRAR